jgi:RimJ/RimL family protein N-acetyltransferase/8-oxo-dGTP pyrophosphatase MutT (NUDIX family)
VTVPTQPTLRDGDVVLRPWRDSDVEPARLQHDEEIALWFGFTAVVPTAQEHAEAIARWRSEYADDRRTVNFVVERDGEIAGSVAVRRSDDGVGELSWTLYRGHRGRGTGRRAVRLLIAYCFDQLGLARVEAHVEPENLASLRLASRAGLRREGVVRSLRTRGGERRDYVLLARLAADARPESADGFRAVLNSGLPRKRVISQGLLRDPAGRVLMCELTYKPDWDLPGGVVEPGESPYDAVRREIEEELGVSLPPTRLLAVDWLPPWAGWDDACLLVFDLATVAADLVETMVFEPREIAAVHWCSQDEVAAHSRPHTADRIRSAVEAATTGGTGFLHGGRPYPHPPKEPTLG